METVTECGECRKLRDGWCRYKGVLFPNAVPPQPGGKLCRPAVGSGAETKVETPSIGSWRHPFMVVDWKGEK